jgi:hypothetical protein
LPDLLANIQIVEWICLNIKKIEVGCFINANSEVYFLDYLANGGEKALE